MYNPWFFWAVLGILCIGFEMLVPGFVLFFFGLGGLVTAVCSLIPFVAAYLWIQILVFLVASIFSLVILRKKFSTIFKGSVLEPQKVDSDANDVGALVDIIETVSPSIEGRIRFKGTSWKAFSIEDELLKGTRARIVRRDGLVYFIEKI